MQGLIYFIFLRHALRQTPGNLITNQHLSIIWGVLGSFGDLVRQDPNNSVYLASYGRAIMILLQVCQPTNSFALSEGGYYVSPLGYFCSSLHNALLGIT